MAKLNDAVLAGGHPPRVFGGQLFRKPFLESTDQVRLHRPQRAQIRRCKSAQRLPERRRMREIIISQQLPVVQISLEDHQVRSRQLFVQLRINLPHSAKLVRRRPKIVHILQVQSPLRESTLQPPPKSRQQRILMPLERFQRQHHVVRRHVRNVPRNGLHVEVDPRGQPVLDQEIRQAQIGKQLVPGVVVNDVDHRSRGVLLGTTDALPNVPRAVADDARVQVVEQAERVAVGFDVGAARERKVAPVAPEVEL